MAIRILRTKQQLYLRRLGTSPISPDSARPIGWLFPPSPKSMRPLALCPALALSRLWDFDYACSAIGSRVSSIPNVTVFDTVLVLGGTSLTFPDTDLSCVPHNEAQFITNDICRITMAVATSVDSKIHIEGWLPRNWTGRFLSTGNGGLSGCIKYSDMSYASSLGFATFGTNNGHNGTSGAAFATSPEILADFVYRSIHTNAIIGKHITNEFYGSPHTNSYYFGCSTGGRQGLKSVQDFPDDFDGVIAGAPAAAMNELLSRSGQFFNITGPPSAPTFIPVNTWRTTIHNDILAQCDTIDGVEDNTIEDPNLCDYKPERLLCRDDQDEHCLTDAQVQTVRNIFSPFIGSDGKLIYPRAQPGSEVNIAALMYNGKIFQYTSDWFRFVICNSSFDPTTLTLKDYEHAIALDPFNVSTFKPELSSFRNRNGKLIMYHGQADGHISPKNSERYYDLVAAAMSSSTLDDFFRFFRISGLAHCSGGKDQAPWHIGQVVGGSLDPERNVLMAMVRWVEEGVAPDTIMGTSVDGDVSRKHCRWPLRTTYLGGDSRKPESWGCEAQ